ncbi:hypothetical protein J6590_076720 [Homalodisca vitripennis]|nr:hypothetical protein J6590_076720 [Homalodisca vitripennis]
MTHAAAARTTSSTLDISKTEAVAGRGVHKQSTTVLVKILDLTNIIHRVFKRSFITGVTLNVGKCTVQHPAPHPLVEALNVSGMSFMLGGMCLAVCEKVKTLGLMLDSKLPYTCHVTQATQLKSLYRFKYLLPKLAKLQLIRSHWSYCTSAFLLLLSFIWK